MIRSKTVDSKTSFLNVVQDGFEEAIAKSYEAGVGEDILVEALPTAVDKSRKEAKAVILEQLRRAAPAMLRARRKEITGFEKRNFTRWGGAFDRLEMLIVMVEEVAQENDKKLRREAIDSNDYKFEALSSVVPKAILIAREILCLLRGGYPDAALTRWRSLYELSVIAQFLSQQDETIALRYLASFDFRALRAAREYNAHAERANLAPFSAEELSALEARANGIALQIGAQLKKDYDWAFPALSSRYSSLKPDRVNFTHIEESLGMDHWRPRIRAANQHVHAGYRPHATLLGVCESRDPVALVGPSNSGFVDPFQLGAIALTHVASAFLLTHPNLDRIVCVDMFLELSDEIGKIAIRLERETLEEHEAGERQRLS